MSVYLIRRNVPWPAAAARASHAAASPARQRPAGVPPPSLLVLFGVRRRGKNGLRREPHRGGGAELRVEALPEAAGLPRPWPLRLAARQVLREVGPRGRGQPRQGHGLPRAARAEPDARGAAPLRHVRLRGLGQPRLPRDALHRVAPGHARRPRPRADGLQPLRRGQRRHPAGGGLRRPHNGLLRQGHRRRRAREDADREPQVTGRHEQAGLCEPRAFARSAPRRAHSPSRPFPTAQRSGSSQSAAP